MWWEFFSGMVPQKLRLSIFGLPIDKVGRAICAERLTCRKGELAIRREDLRWLLLFSIDCWLLTASY
jgi:hypothetical protein